MEFEMQPYIVYVKLDERNLITAVNSSAFLADATGWTEIDQGFTQRHHHAQTGYFEENITDERGIKRYKAVTVIDAPEGEIIAEFVKDGVTYWIFERTQEEMDADYVEPTTLPSQLDIIEAQVTYTAMMTDTLLGG